MRIILSPQRRDENFTVIKAGDKLTVMGEEFDFSPIGNGDVLPASAVSSMWFLDKIERVEGELVLTLLFPNPLNYSPEQAFPVDLVNVPDGPVAFPQSLPDVSDATQQEVQA
ncbi:hypothetical protein PS718_01628 [Pseudomonas fluorescens]|uniref:Uncharacterized protein n=1 Tax=Pseudomonas fluorescens TaxID=294 RepID=A0A5E7B801_PSEFL|nr:hypothetical protein [Pseudomonas fluorescens]VVN87706.1 hypothetical protein PS718_01628 [Pseudomonas fluorescens]